MIRTFLHSFNPAQLNPIPGDTVDLDVSEIENAGIREVLQTPGTAYGAWSIIDALLTPTGAGTPFIFKEPLGHAREVKVALSGLFGRFVARAYLERYFNIKIFAHLGGRTIDLDRRLKVRVRRLSRGDLPDWVACTSNLSDLTVAEAKGCHDGSGPASALRRAWRQAKRINITAGAQKISVKRIAIATRWGIASPRPTDAYISVRDPIEEGDRIKAEESDAVFAGLLRLHIANLIRGLGHAELANALCRLTQQGSARSLRDEVVRAVSLLDSTRTYEAGEIGRLGGLVGGVITRAGPIADTTIAPADQKALAHLNLRPVFVGVDRNVIRAAIDGDLPAVRARIEQLERFDEFARPDGAGGWIIQLGDEGRIIDRLE